MKKGQIVLPNFLQVCESINYSENDASTCKKQQ